MVTLEVRSFSAPITVEHPSSLMPSSSYPRMIKVSLRGEAGSINSILDDDIEVFADLEAYETPGTYLVPVKWRKKGAALLVDPIQISVEPMEISFSLDHKISKFVPIIANFRGQVEAGFSMTSYNLNPAQIIVDGPMELMREISEVYTEQIDLDGRISDFTVTAAILRGDPLINIRGNGTTEFFGNLNQIIPVRNILDVPIVITGLMEGLMGELEVKTGSIHLEGDNKEAVEMFVPAPDFLKIDCSGIVESGIYILRVIRGSADNVILRTEPPEVQVKISHIEDTEN
jgi:hypothetical protein